MGRGTHQTPGKTLFNFCGVSGDSAWLSSPHASVRASRTAPLVWAFPDVWCAPRPTLAPQQLGWHVPPGVHPVWSPLADPGGLAALRQCVRGPWPPPPHELSQGREPTWIGQSAPNWVNSGWYMPPELLRCLGGPRDAPNPWQDPIQLMWSVTVPAHMPDEGGKSDSNH